MSRGSRDILTFINGVVILQTVREQEEIEMKRCNGSEVTCHSSDASSTFWLKCRLPPFSISSRDFSRDFPTVESKYQTYSKLSKEVMISCQNSPELLRM